MAWISVPIQNKVFENVSETTLNTLNAALENAYVNELGGISRFPQLDDYVVLGGAAPVYLEEWRGDLIAVTGGNVYRIDNNGVVHNVTSAVVTGAGRVIFAKTEDELVMAAGGPIIRLRSDMTELLSPDAPESTHVAFVSGYLIAIEPGSGRFFVSQPGQYDQWDPLDVFSAEGNPDNLVAALVTEFSELMLAGTDSIEQFDAVPNGDRPFFKRWGLGAGLDPDAIYTFISVDNRTWGINKQREWVAFSTQLANIASGDVQNTLERLDDIRGSWAAEFPVDGHRFQVIQAPRATNVYGNQGVTLLFDYLNKRWSTLYSWNNDLGLPQAWPGTSFKQVGAQKYVGGKGKVYKVGRWDSSSVVQRMLWRSGHLSGKGKRPMRVDKARIRLRRGDRINTTLDTISPIISVRVNKNNMGFGRWVRKDLGLAGQRNMVLNFPAMGIAETWQFEIAVTDNIVVEIAEFELDTTVLNA